MALYVPPTGETDQKKQNQSLQLIGGVTSTNTANITTNTASIAAHEAAWTAYTPTLVSTVGTITTLGTLAGRYKLIGKTCFIQISLAITTNGTGSSSLTSSLPFAPAATAYIGGREIAVNGKTLSGTSNGLTTALNVCNYDNSYAGADGVTLVLEGVYEST